MAEAGLARTVFYRYFVDLPSLAPALLPDSDDAIVDRVRRIESGHPQDLVLEMVDELVATFAEHGRLLRAIDDAARHDPAVADRLETALVGPRLLSAALLEGAAHAPSSPHESARMLMAAHRAYLLDAFGAGHAPDDAPARARAALLALWQALLR